MYNSAKSSHGHSHGTAAGALDRLHDLHERAKDFHKQVKRSHKDPAHTEADFRALVDAYHHALDALGDLDSHVRTDFRDVDTHMRGLMDFYGGRDCWARERQRR